METRRASLVEVMEAVLTEGREGWPRPNGDSELITWLIEAAMIEATCGCLIIRYGHPVEHIIVEEAK